MLGISEVVVIESFRDVPEDCEAFDAIAAQGNDLTGVADYADSHASPAPIEGRCHMGDYDERDVIVFYPMLDLECGEGGEPMDCNDPESLLIAAEELAAEELEEDLHGAEALALLREEAAAAEAAARNAAVQEFIRKFQQEAIVEESISDAA